MKAIYLLLLITAFASNVRAQNTSKYIQFEGNGRLKYIPDNLGNTIPDFSNVGYKNCESDIPNVSVIKTISPVSGDNSAHIQTAINDLQKLPLNSGNMRGTLLLKKGVYRVQNTLTITHSGIVLRGEGAGSNGTVIIATKKSQYDLLTISGSAAEIPQNQTIKKITDKYVPTGTRTFTIEAGHSFAAGDLILLQRKPNQAWIKMLGMDILASRSDCKECVNWTPEAFTVNYKRVIRSLKGNIITIDAPVMDPIDSKYAEGSIRKYTWPGKIENIGVENIRFESEYKDEWDESHGWNAILISNTQNAWVKDMEAWYFGYSAVNISPTSANISVLNSKCMDPMSNTTGGRKYSFNIDGQRNLVKGCTTRNGRHDYVTGARVCGPNVFTNCMASSQKDDIGPHHRWATGILFDNITGNSRINVQNRMNAGTGHGWAGAQIMLWNCSASIMVVQSPPQHINWAIGCKASVRENGTYFSAKGYVESTGNFVTPSSLYEKQLCDRLGKGQGCVITSNEDQEGEPVVGGIKMFPNPLTAGLLTVSLPAGISEDHLIQINDIEGRLVTEQRLSDKGQIDVSNLIKGIYIVKISLPDRVVIRELLIR